MQRNVTVIDSHWHLYCWNDQQGRDFRDVIDNLIKENGLKSINICAIPVYNGLGPAQNILAALYKLHNPSAYAYAGLVYPQKPFQNPMPVGMDPMSQYEEFMQIGFDGIKMLETKPTEQKSYAIEIDDPYFDGLFSACETNSTPMIWHVADPASFWDINRIPKRFLDRGWFFGDGTYMTHDRIYAQVYNVLERHPRLKVTFAHFFFMSETPEALETLFKKYPGVSVDITPGAEMYADFRKNHSYYRDFFIKYADRIMLGTDTSVNGGDMTRFSQRCQAVRDFITTNQDVFIIAENCNGLHLPQEVRDKILYQNFENAAGSTPKPINTVALKQYVSKYKHLIQDADLLAHIENTVQHF